MKNKHTSLKVQGLASQIVNLSMLEAVKKAEEIFKMFGNCDSCYGKGYSTVIRGEKSYPDFSSDEVFNDPPYKKILVCSCERGKQLLENGMVR